MQLSPSQCDTSCLCIRCQLQNQFYVVCLVRVPADFVDFVGSLTPLVSVMCGLSAIVVGA